VPKPVVDILASDLSLTELAERRPIVTDDPALRLLEAWAAGIDAHPVAADIDLPAAESTRRRPRGTARSVAALTVALTLSSSGIAAAVSGDPFGPINFMVHKFGTIAHPDHAPSDSLLGVAPNPYGQLDGKDAKARSEGANRASRGRELDSSEAPSPVVSSQDEALVSHRQPATAGGGPESTARPSQPHRPLVVKPAEPPRHDGTGERPKPGQGQTPPHHPEIVPEPTQSPWPKPMPDEPPAPPDEPQIAPPEEPEPSAPVG
jgi:hypothetical protein